jgi:hypothetical protein
MDLWMPAVSFLCDGGTMDDKGVFHRVFLRMSTTPPFFFNQEQGFQHTVGYHCMTLQDTAHYAGISDETNKDNSGVHFCVCYTIKRNLT